LFPITGFKSAGFDRFRHLLIRQQTWQIRRADRCNSLDWHADDVAL